ncbi:MAG: hypothetical protein AMXMBFR7_41500 [Planctomycetota bacterium]
MPETQTSSPSGTVAASDPELKRRLLQLMLATRLNDEAEQVLKRRGQGHFQMSSMGHEALAGIALAMDEGDWLHPHYRDRAIVLGRGVTHEQIFLDYYAKRDSCTGGRQMPVHFNSRRHRIVSLSSPVATNFLQAVGMAMTLKERGIPEAVVATIGDAATREGEVMEAIAQAVVDVLPVLFLIEDNRYGISTATEGRTFWTMPKSVVREPDGSAWWFGCRLVEVDGLDPVAVYAAASAALARGRAGEGPTILVAKLERLGSHSSSDDQRLYRSEEDLKAAHARDPVKRFVERCIHEKVLSAADVEVMKGEIKEEIEAALARAKAAPDPDPASVRDSAFAPLPDDLPNQEVGLPAPLAKRTGGQTMAQCLAQVFEQEMQRNPRVNLFGEDIEDPKGDVFSITRGLSSRFPGRVSNSPLAEATILGTAVGRAILGDVPVPCIQFVDFIGPGLNQLFNEVVTMYWRSMGQWNCPMVVMAPYGAYLPGLGAWHSQTNESIFAHIPGLHVAIPSNPGDAAGLLRYALRCNRPVLYLYPKALLHGAEETVQKPGPECLVPFGRARVVRPGRDLTLVTWGNGVAICKQAAQRAAREGVESEILDLRTIVPWDRAAVLDSVMRTGRLMVVHEDAKTCGMAGEVIAEVVQHAYDHLLAPPVRIVKTDDHNPYQFALELSILPSVEGVYRGLKELAAQSHRPVDAVARISDYVAPARGMAPVPPLSAVPRPQSAAPEAAPAAPAARAAGPQRVPVVIPKQSPTDEDATVVRILVQPGAQVKAGDQLAEMEANKGSFEIEAPNDGTVSEIVAREGQRVRVETPLLFLEVAEGAEVDVSGVSADRPGASALQEVRLSPAQLQVGALALKSQLEIPTVSVETEVDVTELSRQRGEFKREIQERHGIHVTYTHLILWSVVQAMQEESYSGFRGRLNATADALLVDPHVHVAFAAEGHHNDLFNPCIKKAERLNFVELVRRAGELTESVRSGSINTLDLQGATVTLTNIGAFEATGGTPFVIPGQVAMVCAGSLLDRPRYVANGKSKEPQLQHRRVLPVKLVFDHRPFNGSHGAGFLRAIKHNLETMNLRAILDACNT